MTNGVKYKIGWNNGYYKIPINEVEEVKPMPCPFCGKECSYSICRSDNCGVVACNYCGYKSSHTATVEGAIMNHNRVCKAVAAYKESEVK